MKKVFLAFAIMVSLVSFGQEKGGRDKFQSEQDVEAHIKKMTADLSLSAKQQSEVKSLFMDQFNKRKQMREERKKEKASGTQISDEKKAEMKKNRIDEQLEMKTKLKKILSEEQLKKLEELKKQRGKEMHKKGPKGERPIGK